MAETTTNDKYVRVVKRRMPAIKGDQLQDVDTPALLLDLDAAEQNIAACIERIAAHPDVQIRPHVKTHKCPSLARLQIEKSQGRSCGVCCQKVIEAEAMVENGIKDVFVSNEIVGQKKIQRLVRLATPAYGNAQVSVVVDNADNAAEMSKTATDMGVTIKVLIEIDVGQRRCGVGSPEEAAQLGKIIHKLPNLSLVGIQAYHGAAQHIRTHENRQATITNVVHIASRTQQLFRDNDLPCHVVTGGGTGTYPLEASSGIFTEVQPGSYIMNDVDYSRNLGLDDKEVWGRVMPGGWHHALFLYATVMSRNTARGYAVLDLGLKATSVDSGLPVLEEEGIARSKTPCGAGDSLPPSATPVLQFGEMSDEHSKISINYSSETFLNALEQEQATSCRSKQDLQDDVSWFSERYLPSIGSKVKLIPGHVDPCCNHHDFLVCIRGDIVEDVWEIAARSPGF